MAIMAVILVAGCVSETGDVTGRVTQSAGQPESAAKTCTPDWQCAGWSVCSSSGTQTRACTDANGCGTDDAKPSESQTCTPPCTENWACTAWSKCSIDGLNVRTCTDTNNCNTTKTKPPESSSCTLLPEQIKSYAIEVTYEDLMRYNENYVGKIVHYKGPVVQIVESDSFLLLAVTKTLLTWDDLIWIDLDHYDGERLLKGDVIDLWGRVKGLKSYETVVGNTATIPEIDLLQVERCVSNWECSSWNECDYGFQSRKCNDLNKCEYATNTPETFRLC